MKPAMIRNDPKEDSQHLHLYFLISSAQEGGDHEQGPPTKMARPPALQRFSVEAAGWAIAASRLEENKRTRNEPVGRAAMMKVRMTATNPATRRAQYYMFRKSIISRALHEHHHCEESGRAV